MAARALWSGSISFGLLQIPVTIHTAEERAEEIHFRQLDKNDLSPIRYERVSAASGKPVEWKDIVKGFEYEPETFVVLDPEEVREARPKATQTIDIQDFVPKDQIDPAYFETPYFVMPQKRAAKAYGLLRKALENKNAIAVATFVLRTKEHLCALMPVGDAIMLETLRYGHELKEPERVPEADLDARELAMAEQLVVGMMTDFEPRKYKDRFHAQVMKMIEEKAKTGSIKASAGKKEKGEVATDVVDLLELLKKSVATKGGHANDVRRPRAKGVKKAARSRGRKRKAA
ncbi:MAG: Ku protein [Deltaproteobacteria bacterium]|nr:Ku protein [Deltaproteobacteria bacterium]